jgi:hypothetical protein
LFIKYDEFIFCWVFLLEVNISVFLPVHEEKNGDRNKNHHFKEVIKDKSDGLSQFPFYVCK